MSQIDRRPISFSVQHSTMTRPMMSAKLVADPDLIASYLEIAGHYEMLAEEEERLAGRLR